MSTKVNIDLYLMLGCFGLQSDGFISCGSVENLILKVNTSIPDYNLMLDYFDQVRLFDKPLFDLNAIRHVVHNLNERFDLKTRPLWSQKQYDLYQKFIHDHKHCGLFIKLELPGQNKQVVKNIDPEKPILIPANKSLRLLRGSKSTT